MQAFESWSCWHIRPFCIWPFVDRNRRRHKVISFATDKDKEYEFTIEWGNSTDTQDCTGNIVESSDVRPSREDIDKILKQFCGNQLQTPPVFSAAKIGGKRAYKMARKGDEFTLQPREVSVELLNITNHREKLYYIQNKM